MKKPGILGLFVDFWHTEISDLEAHMSETEALRKAASCISELLVSTLCTPTGLPGYQPRAMYVWEEEAVQFLREQWERDPETPINDWTAQIVRGELVPSYEGWKRP